MADSTASRFPLEFPRDEAGNLDPTKVHELKKRSHNGKVFLYTDEDVGDVIYRAASQKEFDYWLDKVDDDNASANRTLFDECVLWPDGADKTAIHEFKSALPGSVAQDILRKSGAKKDISGKEL